LKEVVIKLSDRSIKIDEDYLVLFFVKPLFLLFIYFGMYSRFEGFPGLTGGQTTVLLTFGIFCFTLFHKFIIRGDFKLTVLTVFIALYFVLSGVLPLLSWLVFQTDPVRILRYSIEIGVTFAMFFSVYYLIKERIISLRFFIYSFAILGAIASFQLLVSLFQEIRVMRLSGLAGLNYLGNSFAMAAFTWMMVMYGMEKDKTMWMKRYAVYFGFFVVMLALLLTGTRAALISLAVGLFLYQYMGMKSKNFKKYVFYTSIVFALIIGIIAMNVDLSLLWRRFTWEQLVRMANIRFGIYANSIIDLTIMDFLFGRPEMYLFSDEDPFINPHNHFLAIIRYNGIFLFIMSVFVFVALLYKYLALYSLHKNNDRCRTFESSILILFVMVLIYTLFSGGRITRSFSFYIALGYAAGYLALFRNLNSYKEYKEMIF
jgi:hypothetical protein